MKFQKKNDHLFLSEKQGHDGILAVIVDDFAEEAASCEEAESGDARFIYAVAKGLLDHRAAQQIILADFEFDPAWLDGQASECAYFVDVFAGGANRETRGKETVDRLALAGVPAFHIALLTKAGDVELREEFGPEHPYSVISKLIGIDGRGVAENRWNGVAMEAVSHVAKVTDSPYLAAVVRWNHLCEELKSWPIPKLGPLFPTGSGGGGRHEASDWINNHGTLDPDGASWKHGNGRLAELVGQGTGKDYSREAVFTALKGITKGGLGARWLAELAGVSPAACGDASLVYQLVKCKTKFACMRMLPALHTLVSGSARGKWSFEISKVEKNALVLAGECPCADESSAQEAAGTLNMTPAERSKAEPDHQGPGTCVLAVAMLRENDCKVGFHAQGSTLHCLITVPLRGTLP